MKRMTIGRLAQLAGVNIATVRYYERRKLIPPPARHSLRGFRIYPDDAVGRLRFIRAAQRLGFTLSEIQSLLKICGGATFDRGRFNPIMKSKIVQITTQIQALTRMADALKSLQSQFRRQPHCEPSCYVEAFERSARTL